MTTPDIVERLRISWSDRGWVASKKISGLLAEAREAADEIERLRAAAPSSVSSCGGTGPVAWRWRYKGANWIYGNDLPIWASSDDCDEIIEPLYARQHADHDAVAQDALHIVFDGPPLGEGPRFVEVETPEGKSVNAGEWRERPDGYWELVINGRSRNLVGAAETEVGQAVYRRIDALMNADPKPATPEWTELDYLSGLTSSVEEYGSYDGPDPARQQAGEEVGSVPESSGEVPHCNACGRSSRYWHAENRLWNLVMGGPDAKGDPGGILCPNCFIDRAAASGMARRWVVTDVDPDECAKQPSHEERERVIRAVRPVLDRWPMLDASQSRLRDIQAGWIADAIAAVRSGNGGQGQ